MLEKIKKSRLTLKLFSIVLAIVAWLIITYTIDPTISYYVKNVPVTLSGEEKLEEKGLVLTNKKEIETVNVRIRGARSAVINALDTISAKADISDITSEGNKTEEISVDVGVAGVVISDRSSPAVMVKIDRLVDKEVPVKISQSGTERNRQFIIASESDPEKLSLRGAKSELEKVRYALVSLDISTVEADITRPLPYTLVDAEEMRVNCDTLINAPSEINVTSHMYERRTLPISIVLPEKVRDNWTLSIKSQSKDKTDVGIIDAQSEVQSLEAVFDPASYRAGQEEYTLYIKAPDGIYLPESAQSLSAKLVLTGKTSSQVTLDVEVRGAAQDKNVILTSPSVSLKLRGDASKLNKENVRAYVDVSGLASGYYEREIMLDTSEDVTLEETAHIGVTIQ